jgi:hypothetical protein
MEVIIAALYALTGLPERSTNPAKNSITKPKDFLPHLWGRIKVGVSIHNISHIISSEILYDRRGFPTPPADLSKLSSGAVAPEPVLSPEFIEACPEPGRRGSKDDPGFPHTPTRPY